MMVENQYVEYSRLQRPRTLYDHVTSFWQDMMPCVCCASMDLRRILESPSTQNRNKYGDSGSPYFIPCVGWIKP